MVSYPETGQNFVHRIQMTQNKRPLSFLFRENSVWYCFMVFVLCFTSFMSGIRSKYPETSSLWPFSSFLTTPVNWIEAGLSEEGSIDRRTSVWPKAERTGICWSLSDGMSGTCAAAHNWTPNISWPAQDFCTLENKGNNWSVWKFPIYSWTKTYR